MFGPLSRGASVRLDGAPGRSFGAKRISVVTTTERTTIPAVTSLPSERAKHDDLGPGAYDVTFVVGKGRATRMSGRGRIALEPGGVRLVGPRARVDAAFYGACAIALGGAVVALAIVVLAYGLRSVARAPVMYGVGLSVLALLSVGHAILIRVLPFRTEDRRLAFASTMSVEVADGEALIVASERGFNGATWFVFEGGSSEGARFVDEYDTARRGGAPGYR